MTNRVPKGYTNGELTQPEFTAEHYSHMLGVDFNVAYADKEVMWEFEKILKEKDKRILKKAMKFKQPKREVKILERLIILAQVYKKRIEARKRVEVFREKYGESLMPISKPTPRTDLVECSEVDFTMERGLRGD